MKRIFVIILVLAIAMCNAASAVDFEFDKYTDEEIVELAKLLNQEMLNRKIVKQVKVPAGMYVVGKDIPSEKYICKRNPDGIGSSIEIYDGIDMQNYLGGQVLLDEDYDWVVELKDGYVLVASFSFYLEKFYGILFELRLFAFVVLNV